LKKIFNSSLFHKKKDIQTRKYTNNSQEKCKNRGKKPVLTGFAQRFGLLTKPKFIHLCEQRTLSI
jgi:hypothetical protein